MKKLIFIIGLMLVSVIPSFAAQGDFFATGPNEEFRIDSDGDIVGTRGVGNMVMWLPYPAVASSCTVFSIFTLSSTTMLATTTYTEIKGDFDISTKTFSSPRNVTIYAEMVGLTYSTMTFDGYGTFHGVDAKGNLQVETIYFSTSSASTSIYGSGNIAFAKISTFSITLTDFSEYTDTRYNGGPCFNVLVGVGKKFGLLGNITAKSDIYRIEELGKDIPYTNRSLSIDVDYDTIDFVTDPNGARPYKVYYRAIQPR